MTIIWPASMWPQVSSVSLAFRDSRNHSTSIGAPTSSTVKPARSRTVEWRPSQPTTRSARISSSPSGVLARSAGDAAAFVDQVGGLGLHQQMKARIAPALLGEEIEEIPLRHQRDEFAVRRQMA